MHGHIWPCIWLVTPLGFTPRLRMHARLQRAVHGTHCMMAAAVTAEGTDTWPDMALHAP